MREQCEDQIASDKAGAAHHQDIGSAKGRFVHRHRAVASVFGGARWLTMSLTPCASYQLNMRWIVSRNPTAACHPSTSVVRDGSRTTAGTSSAFGGTIGTGSLGAMPR